MATGHAVRAPHAGVRRRQLAAVLAEPDVRRGLRVPFAIDRGHDIPYVGGVSRDGRTVYIDRRFPSRVAMGGRGSAAGRADLTAGLVRHEQVEGALLRTGRYSYAAAHELATAAENAVYCAMGLDPEQAQAAYPRYVRAAHDETLVRVPPDLELRPYTEPPLDRALLRRLLAAMHAGAAAA
jgi:hypothetical protein